MVKIILLTKRKSGLSKEEFRDHYENHHVPLIKQHFAVYYINYQRNYLLQDVSRDTPALGGTTSGSWDCITEMAFDSQERMTAMLTAAGDPTLRGIIASDEQDFIDRSSMKMLICESAV